MTTPPASATLSPSNTLTIASSTAPPPEKTTPTPSERFIMFGDSWLNMQTSIAAALQLPISQGDFDTKYGTFPALDKAEVAGCVQAMTDLQSLSTTFGDPIILKQKIAQDGSYLTGSTPPPEIYGHIIWLALQIQNVASTFTSTFSVLQQVLSPAAGDEKTRAENLRALLTGPGGLASNAASMHTLSANLSSKLASFDTDVNAAAAAMSTYTGSSSKILADANTLLGQITADIATLMKASDTAHDAWRDYTIAAVTTSVGITILSFGLLLPVAIGLGIGLGVAAAKQLDLYNSLCTQIKAQQADQAKKTRLTVDLRGLNGQMPSLVAATATFRQDLSVIEGVWTNIGGNLNYIATNYTDKQLADYPWVTQATHILDAQSKWTSISNSSSQFTENSLVSFNTAPFGTPISS